MAKKSIWKKIDESKSLSFLFELIMILFGISFMVGLVCLVFNWMINL